MSPAEHNRSRAELSVDDYLLAHDGLLRIESSEGGLSLLARQAEDLRQALIEAHPELHEQAMEQRRAEVMSRL